MFYVNIFFHFFCSGNLIYTKYIVLQNNKKQVSNFLIIFADELVHYEKACVYNLKKIIHKLEHT